MTQRSRRTFLRTGAVAGVVAAMPKSSSADELGHGPTPYGERSPFEKSSRFFRPSATPASAHSLTPLQDLYGIITPSGLHYEVHHAGVPTIDPQQHQLLIHGLVKRPLLFTMDDLRRFPAVSRVHFLECAGNSGGEQIERPAVTPGRSHGLLSCSEWTGVPLRILLDEAGLKSDGRWILAEGSDAIRMARSIPLEKAMDDAIVAYGQNGEALRPEQGYPVRWWCLAGRAM